VSVVVRRLNADEARLLTAARLVAVEHAPYLAHALFSTQPIAAEELGTFAVDRGWRLYVDPATLVGWGPTLAGGVLVHEVGHLVRAHAERADALGAGVDHQRWNFATDAAINDDLLAAGVQLPDGVVTPAALGLADGGIEEVYYAALSQQTASHMKLDGADVGGCGSGAGDPGAPPASGPSTRTRDTGTHITTSPLDNREATVDQRARIIPTSPHETPHPAKSSSAKSA